MGWRDLDVPEWYDPIVCYPEEGVNAQEEKIRAIVDQESLGLESEEVDAIVEGFMTELGDVEGPVTKKMIVRAVGFYKQNRRVEDE